MRTIDKIINKLDTSRGAPMGREGSNTPKPKDKRVFDCFVPMSDGVYDKGGAYWGSGSPVRVQYTKDLTYIRFYRVGDNLDK